MKQADRRLIVVLGMHRSGTSAITRGLQALGVDLGSNLMPPVPGVNEKGFYEDAEINRLNIELLDALGSDWHALSGISAALFDHESLASLKLRAIELMRARTGSQPFGLKDPRIARLLPFWQAVFRHLHIEPSYVIAVRHPMSVAHSLGKRDGFENEKGYYLWLEHAVPAILETTGAQRMVVDFDLLMANPQTQLTRMAHTLNLPFDPDSSGAKEYICDFLDEALRHTRFEPDDLRLDPGMPADVVEAYGWLLRLARDEIDMEAPQIRETFGQLDARLCALSPALGYMARSDRKIAERDGKIAALDQAMAERNGQISCLTALIEEGRRMADTEIARLNALIEEGQRTADTEIARLNALIEEEQRTADTEIARLNALIEEEQRTADTEIVRLNALIEEEQRMADKEIVRLNDMLAGRDEQVAGLTDEIARRNEWASRLDAELGETSARLHAITRSNSWRLTLPLREARRWISSPLWQATRYGRAGVAFLKRNHHRLPVGYKIKKGIYNSICMKFPGISGIHAGKPPALSLRHQPPPVNEGTGDSGQYIESMLDGMLPIRPDGTPHVSVVIPVHGKISFTLRCLVSISENPPRAAFEVIVVDDCSPDNSAEILGRIGGIRVIRNAANQGFIRSCNIGAEAAKGEYLYFLNNDTEVTPGWLDELARTFHEFPGAGLAGSRLVFPDGKLQEAGGIIWQDGSAWNFGRNQDPMLPVYNYAREVDYCSGASIMIPRRLFIELGGFDEHYLPAYCEDSDIALKIRDKGYRVVYQPLSTVIHYEGITSGTDTTQGVKAYQVENTRKLFERWRERLESHQAPGVDADNAKDRMAGRRVLVLDHCTPTPNQDAGSVTVFNLMLLLREMGFQVTFIPEDNFLYMPEYTAALQRAGIEVLYAPYVTSVEKHLRESGGRYHLAFLFRPAVVERNIKAIRRHCPGAKVLFHTIDLHFMRMQREAELQDDPAKMRLAAEMKQREFAAIHAADASIVHSTAELELLRAELPGGNVRVFPLIMDIRGTSKVFSDRRDIVFVGSYQHTPNVDAVQFFVSEIMPLLRTRLPNVRFHAVGSKPPAGILNLAGRDVIIAGFVEDLDSLLDKMRVSVAPLRYGAGIKGKIGSAMAAGLPVVATSLAAEGMSLADGENILVADGAEAFASTVAALYEDEALWNKLSRAGLEFADRAWGAEAAWGILANILSELGLDVRRNNHPLRLFSSASGSGDHPGVKQQPADGLQPVFVAYDRGEYEQGQQKLAAIRDIEKRLIESADTEAFTVEGFCVPCDKTVPMLVDMLSGGQYVNGRRIPNWRERLVCPSCRMNNRQRLIAALVRQQLGQRQGEQVYFMEQVTPIYRWATAAFPQHRIIGSEYLGYEYGSGQMVKGIRHEDVMNLSFDDDSLDMIVSNDVFEHVPEPGRAFAECARVLRPGGVMLATIPFHSGCDVSVPRAQLAGGELRHLLPQVFHGNPVSEAGSLVFTDFGWDILVLARKAGFDDTQIAVYASSRFGHLGGGQSVFVFRKRSEGESP